MSESHENPHWKSQVFGFYFKIAIIIVIFISGIRYNVEPKVVYQRKNEPVRSQEDNINLIIIVNYSIRIFNKKLSKEKITELLPFLPDSWSDGDISYETSNFTKRQLEAL